MSSSLNYYIRVQIGEAKSKEAEDKAVMANVEEIQKEILKSGLTDDQIWELVLRILYAEMLGHDTNFAHSFIVNNVSSNCYKVKRISYLACSILLEEDSGFRIMMVASL